MKRPNGFTLIELVVVIMILGILAGIAAPKLLGVSSDARESSLKQTLSVVRDAIELYAANNNGALPPCTATGADFRAALKDYIRGDFPDAPVGAAGNNGVMPSGTAGNYTPITPGLRGWLFNTEDGKFIANTYAADSDGVDYNTY